MFLFLETYYMSCGSFYYRTMGRVDRISTALLALNLFMHIHAHLSSESCFFASLLHIPCITCCRLYVDAIFVMSSHMQAVNLLLHNIIMALSSECFQELTKNDNKKSKFVIKPMLTFCLVSKLNPSRRKKHNVTYELRKGYRATT